MTREETKSCIGTIEMLQRLAYNIHGVMDVIDANNCKKIIKTLEQEPQIRPKGHWICDGKGRNFADYHCSECGLKLALCGQDIKQRQDSGYSLFCGGCGADMREVEK